ncbi:MAG: HNH endonuclease [Acidiferrobacteraceae bacterium]|nr:HNH endonuclease [Acidiferrobacteraceae bacterium]
MFEDPTEEIVRKEREKGRKLKKTQWWQNKLNIGLCHYCGDRFSRDQLTMDHVVPISRGGKSTKGNVVPACKDCNNQKKIDIPVEKILKKDQKLE